LFYRGFGEYHQKNFEQATKDFNRAFDLDPSLYAQIGKALSDAITHRDADGLETLRSLETKIREQGVGDPEATYKIAQVYSILGDKTSALRALHQSIEGGFFSYPYLATDPLLGALRKESEFTQILEVAHHRHEAFKRLLGPPTV
jgi:tetratricopeptide (TPR) repeat protein